MCSLYVLNLCFLLSLTHWVTTEASSSTKEIYKETGVHTTKVTHHRTAALQWAGFMGLAPWQINTMTNHILDKQHSAYQSQAEWEVRRCEMTLM